MATVCAVEVLDRNVVSAWIWLNHVLNRRLTAPWTWVVVISVKRHGQFLSGSELIPASGWETAPINVTCREVMSGLSDHSTNSQKNGRHL
jgi:hypothetical protein